MKTIDILHTAFSGVQNREKSKRLIADAESAGWLIGNLAIDVLELDSLDMAEMACTLSEAYEVDVVALQLEEYETLQDIVEHVEYLCEKRAVA